MQAVVVARVDAIRSCHFFEISMNSPDNSVRNKTTNPKEPKWRHEGGDPDYRFSLANERTFLAWMRTSLAILAAGVLLDQFSVKLGSQVFVVLVSAGLCLVAAILSVLSYIKWRDYEVAMRHKRVLPLSRAMIFLSGVVLLLGILLTALILIPH